MINRRRDKTPELAKMTREKAIDLLIQLSVQELTDLDVAGTLRCGCGGLQQLPNHELETILKRVYDRNVRIGGRDPVKMKAAILAGGAACGIVAPALLIDKLERAWAWATSNPASTCMLAAFWGVLVASIVIAMREMYSTHGWSGLKGEEE